MKIISLLFCFAVFSFAQISDSLKDEILMRQTLLFTEKQKTTGEIVGSVIDAATKMPIEKAKVEILGTGKSVTTGKDGQYSLSDISKGFYQIKASAKGFSSEVQNNIEVENNVIQKLFFSLTMNPVDPPDFVAVEKQPQPLLGHSPSPQYPLIAQRDSVEGVIWIKLVVDEDGIVKKTQVLKKTFTKNNVEIDLEHAKLSTKAAADSLTITVLDAASRWKFSPAILKGEPVRVWVSIPFKFKLDSPYKEDKKLKK